MTCCAHCPTDVQSISGGKFIHTDTHNTHGVDGHPAEPAPAPVIAIADLWTRMTQGQQQDHRERCASPGCALCEKHRVSCYECGHDVDPDDETCESCGSHWPYSIDPHTR